MRKIELNGRGWRRGSRPLNCEPPVIDDDISYLRPLLARAQFPQITEFDMVEETNE